MATIAIGDYYYSTDGSVRVVDKTKTSYEPILSSFDYEEKTYNITDMNHCFERCTNLTQAPEIPEGVTNMNACFYRCTNLTQAPEIPESVTSMGSCFESCTNLIQAPEIPENVTNVDYCFYNCTSLQGKITINNNPIFYQGIFTNITKNIQLYVVGSSSKLSKWKAIANGYPIVSIGLISIGNSIDIGDYTYRIFSIEETSTGLTASVEANAKENKEYYSEFLSEPVNGSNFLITTLQSCFWNCRSLIEAPKIPSSVINMDFCFSYCTSLIKAPEIPKSVTDMRSCFDNCRSLTKAPEEIPEGVTNMRNCFSNCRSLTQAPEIPSSVINMSYCFSYCDSLSNNINIKASNLDDTTDIFTRTLKNIFLIGIDENISILREVARQYSNVHYEDDDNPAPKLIVRSIQRGLYIDDVWKQDDDEGTKLKIRIELIPYTDLLPIGYTNEVDRDGFKLYINESLIPSNWNLISGNIYETDYDIPNDLIDEKFTIQITGEDRYKTSNIAIETITGIFAMLDFMPGGQGMAIGRVAKNNGLSVQIPTAIGEELTLATTYFESTDESVDSSKKYYELSDDEEYELVTPQSGDSPLSKNWYEHTDAIDLNNYQLVVGKYNKEKVAPRFIVGNGSENNPSNFLEVGDIIKIGNSESSYVQIDHYSIQLINASHSNALTVDWNGNINSYNTNYIRNIGGTLNGGIRLVDKNDFSIAYMKALSELDSQDRTIEGFNIGTNRTVGDSTIWNSLRLMIDADGNSTVAINQPLAWQKALDLIPSTLSLGQMVVPAILTSTAGDLVFNIPLGRVYPSGTTISSITFNIVVRAANQSGTGMYIVKSAAGGASGASFNSNSTFTFYCGSDASRSLAQSKITKTLQGTSSNIYIYMTSGVSHFFSGDSTRTGYVNNNPCTAHLTNVVVNLNLPS